MATYTIYASASNSGRITSSDNNYNNARSGSGTLSTSTAPRTGQFKQTVSSTVYEAFIEFDTSVLSGKTIVSATLEGYVSQKFADASYTAQARLRDFGASITTGDWVAGASLSALTSLATLTSAAATVSAWNAFTDVAMVANINTTGNTRMLLCSSRTVSGSAPGTSTSEYLVFPTPDGTNSFRLVVETDENNGALDKTVGTISLSSAGSIETNGVLAQTVGTIALSAAGEGVTAGAGVLNKTVGTISLASTVTQETNAYLEATVGTIFLTTGALLPLEGDLSATISLSLSGIIARNTEGVLAQTVGRIFLATSTAAGISGELAKTVGTIYLAAAESAPPWPSIFDFPQAPLDGTWRRVRGDDTLRSDRAVGARQYRGRNGGYYADVTFAVMLKTMPQVDELDRFFRDECKSGVRPFYWLDPETGETVKWTWAAPPAFNHVARDNYRVECALRREAA